MTSVRDLHPLKGEPNFRWRGGNPSRVEALTDMVFAFALTLLVVSNAPPGSFDELVTQLWGFPGFAAAFAMLLLLWHSHYVFFRRYALEDQWTTVLNAGLLFLIVFFVYPLKYLATMLSQFVRSIVAGAPQPPMSLEHARVDERAGDVVLPQYVIDVDGSHQLRRGGVQVGGQPALPGLAGGRGVLLGHDFTSRDVLYHRNGV